MINIKFNTQQFVKTMTNSVEYSSGFMQGVESSRLRFNQELGLFIKDALNKYIDSRARANPDALHHIYEWGQAGSSSSRLFEFQVTPSQNIIRFTATFLPSSSVSPTSDTPFRDKAEVMETGMEITIEPKNSEVLVFEKDGETIFTRKEISISDPGGRAVVGSFANVVNDFFNNYLTVGLLRSSGIFAKLERLAEFKTNFSSGARGGRRVGVQAGKKYMNIGGFDIQ